MKAGGEDNKAKAKLAAVLAAVNFWVKHEGKVEPTLKVKVEEKELSATIKLEVTAPSTGKVRKVIVKVGDEVKIGDPLIILKKMS